MSHLGVGEEEVIAEKRCINLAGHKPAVLN